MRWGVAAAGIVLVSTAARQDVALKELMPKGMVIGVAINQRQFEGTDAAAVELITKQFNQISPENALKFQSTQPAADRYTFDAADHYVQFGLDRHMQVVGHNLVWHSQTGVWVFQGADGKPADRDTLLARMRDHIHTVVGRYKGRINGWDVVNEAIAEDGTLRRSPWLDIIGPEYIAMAFRFAHEADPAAALHYNDFSVEHDTKRQGIVRLVTSLRAEGVPITAIGMQEHQKLDWPSVSAIDSAIVDLAATGVKLMVTELDVDVLPSNRGQRTEAVEQQLMQSGAPDPYRAGLPQSVQTALAHRYAEVVRVYLQHRNVISRMTFWGVDDGDSWLNNFPVRGRVNYPLLFDRRGMPKEAYDSVIAAARTVRTANASR